MNVIYNFKRGDKMNVIGIIAEYNPFHNGHLYHLKKIKEMYKDSIVILVLGGSFTQRGDVSILNKWTKTKIALEAGIDLVIELPFPFATASADIFAKGAIEILNKLQVETIIFGSESNDIEGITKLVDAQLNNDVFSSLIKIYLKMGYNYPTSLSKALEEITGTVYNLPNDILGISYVKAIMENNYKIIPQTIQRTTNYHNESLKDKVVSAKAIRKAILENENIDQQVPKFVLKYLPKHSTKIDNYFSFLKYKIITEDNLEKYTLVDQGMNEKLKKIIAKCNNFDDIIQKIKSKNLTYNRLSRMLLYILCGYTKEKAKTFKNISYIRLLGFSDKGKTYLNTIKKSIDLPIISKFKRDADPMLIFEYQITKIYALGLEESLSKRIIKEETSNCPIRKDDLNEFNGKN